MTYLNDSAFPCNGSTVYFIGCAVTGTVKIGFTKGPSIVRLKGVQTGSAFPLELLAEIPGGRSDEAMLHSVFAPIRLHGEWFERRGKLDDMIGYLSGGASFEAALWDCVATGLLFPWRDIDSLMSTADCSALPQWCLAGF